MCFGTVDTWIVWKLTEGKVHATDYSNVSTTVMYDPYTMSWSNLLLSLLEIPNEILPEVRDSGGDFGICVPHLFGQGIPITGESLTRRVLPLPRCVGSRVMPSVPLELACF